MAVRGVRGKEAGGMTCPGVKSAVNPSHPLRLCLGCKRYQWGLDGKGPAEHDGKVWVCKSRTLEKT